MPAPRRRSATAGLVRAGFAEAQQAEHLLGGLGHHAAAVTDFLARTADPDRALSGLCDLRDALEALEVGSGAAAVEAVAQDEGTAMRLLRVLGASRALTDHLVRHPGQWHELTDPTLGSTRPAAYAVRQGLMAAVGADGEDLQPVSSLPVAAAADALRVEYRRVLLRLAARDLAHHVGFEDVAAELSDLAAGTLDAALAVARAEVRAQVGVEALASCRLAVIAMGKCGGHELNYVSDVDVVFVGDCAGRGTEAEDQQTALRTATRLASAMMRICSDDTREGTIWPVDANLRPEGKSGPLVRTVASHLGYYQRWAKTWEFQALLKARPVAGDLDLGREYVETIGPLVWTAAERDGFVTDVQAMRRRVVEHIPAGEAARQLKLGSGGLRDVEFAVQLLQLVHGRADERLREGATLSALARLIQGGYVGHEDGSSLHDAYTFLRTLEHRIQLFALRRTHVVPEEESALRRLGRSLGHVKEPREALLKEWHYHQREVRRLHEKLFYRPLLTAVARFSSDEVRLSPEAARARLTALGYLDPRAAMRHLEALTTGLSRTAAIQRTLLPAMLQWFADAPDPDAGLLGFRKISEALGATPWYLRSLRDEGQAAQWMAQVLATSRYATDLLQREPEGVRIIADRERLRPLSRESVQGEMLAGAERRDTPQDAVLSIRGIRRRELLRISIADLCVPFGVAEVGYALTDVTSATLEATLAVAVRKAEAERRTPMPTRMAIVAMGRYGGHELGYGSDADVMFVHDPLPDADPQLASSMAQAVANDVRRLLAAPASDPALDVDAGLRPEGKQGALVRSLDSYAAYYRAWSAVWEAQALLRAVALVGDPELCAAFTALIDPLRFPAAGLSPEGVTEVRRIKARVDAERLPRDADPAMHFKLGRGGLADVEWTVQLLQMQHAGRLPALRTTRTLDALRAARDEGLLSDGDADGLEQAWLFASRARNATVQVRGRPSDQLPRDSRERAAVAAILLYPPGGTETMVNDYLRGSRRARQVVDQVFWG